MSDGKAVDYLTAELADARERVKALEQKLEEQARTPGDREEEARWSQGESTLDAYRRGRDKNVSRVSF